LHERLAQGLNAKRVQFFQKDGKATDMREIVDYSERRQYCELIARVKGLMPTREDERRPEGPVILRIVYDDSSGEETEGPSRELIVPAIGKK
jgi:hypothetical protein